MTESATTADASTLEFFQPLVGKTFRLRAEPFELKLESATAKPIQGWNSERTPFSLLFVGPASPVLIEGFHTFDVADGPEAALYIMPINTVARDRQDYQAIFN